MALTKLSAGSDQYWLLNDIPHQRGQFDISAKIGADVVEIYNLATLKSLARGNYFEFSPDGVTPYASTQLLIDDLKGFFFRSVAGGGGGAVDSYSAEGSLLDSITANVDTIVSDMTITPDLGTYNVGFNSEYELLSGNVTAQAAADLQTAYNALIAIPDTGTHIPAFGSNETLLAGVYTIAAAGSLTGNINLDSQGDPNAIFIIRFGAAFAITAGSTVTLQGGTQACNVFWMANGAITTGATSQLKGNLIANGVAGSITFGALANLEGKALATNGGIITSSCVVTNTPSCASVNFGTIDNFVIFATNGSLTNVGGSTITGDIGTNNGSITGFGSATVNGTTYLPGVNNNSVAFFSVYQNGVLIPNSSRRRELDINTVDVSLQSVAIVGIGEDIDIRCRIDSGTIKLTNRILTLTKTS